MKKINSEYKFIIRILILVAIGLMFVVYGNYLTKTVRNETIRSAELVGTTDDGYIISFDGEAHSYSFD